MSDEEDPQCRTCEQTLSWHKANASVVHHEFNPGTLPHSMTFGSKRADGSRGPSPVLQGATSQTHGSPWPFDPVLRQALIDKGVLTVEDLNNAEAKIRMVTATAVWAQNSSPSVVDIKPGPVIRIQEM